VARYSSQLERSRTWAMCENDKIWRWRKMNYDHVTHGSISLFKISDFSLFSMHYYSCMDKVQLPRHT